MLSKRVFGALRCLSGVGLALLLTTQGRLWPWLFAERTVPADTSRVADNLSFELLRWAKRLLSPALEIAETAAPPDRRIPPDSNDPSLSLRAALPDLSPPRGVTATLGADLIGAGRPWLASALGGSAPGGIAECGVARPDFGVRTALLIHTPTPPGAASRVDPCIGTAICQLAPPR